MLHETIDRHRMQPAAIDRDRARYDLCATGGRQWTIELLEELIPNDAMPGIAPEHDPIETPGLLAFDETPDVIFQSITLRIDRSDDSADACWYGPERVAFSANTQYMRFYHRRCGNLPRLGQGHIYEGAQPLRIGLGGDEVLRDLPKAAPRRNQFINVK